MKCQDTGVDKGIIVSSKGFYNTTKIKAEKLGIKCLLLEKVASFDWLLPSGATVLKQDLKHVDWTIIPETEQAQEEQKKFSLVDQNGKKISKVLLNRNVLNKIRGFPLNFKNVGEQEAMLIFKGDGLFLKYDGDERLLPIKQLKAQAKYTVSREFAPFELYRYSDKNQDNEITETAVGDLNIGKSSYNVMFVHKKEKGGKLFIVPKEKA